MNKQEIISVFEELHKTTGFRISLHGANHEEIAAYPENALPFCNAVKHFGDECSKCKECDRLACSRALDKKTTYIYKCRFGLTEAVSPLYSFGIPAGFLMMGQIAESEAAASLAILRLKQLIGNGDCDVSEADISVTSPDMLLSYVKIATICGEYLTMSNSISTTKPTVGQMAKKYIGENLGKRILIGDICEYLKCSKSTLLSGFKKQFGITVNSYITQVKLDHAARLLSEGELTISEIANETGFSDQSYFSKVFSSKYGITPSEYRNDARNL